jgi:prepilin peptidase CpaA
MSVEAWFDIVRVVLLFATLAIAATTDTLARRVPNWLTYSAMALGLALGFGMGGVGTDAPWFAHHLVSHSLGLLLGAGIFLIAWWARGVKGGEVKLAAAVGALSGLQFTVAALFWSSLVGAVMGLWILVMRGQLLEGLRRSVVRYAAMIKTETPTPADDGAKVSVPYAVAMAFGTLWAFFLVEVGKRS